MPRRIVGAVAAAIMFAACGALGGLCYEASVKDTRGSWSLVAELWNGAVALPFAIACFVWFWRNRRGLIASLLVIATWECAYWAAHITGSRMHTLYFPMCLGGLVGGAGLSLCQHFARSGMTRGKVTGLCGVATLAALMFALELDSLPQRQIFELDFAIWQTAVGTCLYLLNTQFKSPLDGRFKLA